MRFPDMTRFIKMLFLAGISMIFSACKTNLTTDLYMSDLHGIAWEGGENVTTSATMEFEIISREQCQKSANRIARIIDRYVLDFTPISCYDEGLDTFLKADIQMDVIHALHQEEFFRNGRLFAVMVLTESYLTDHIFVYFQTNQDTLNHLKKKVRAEFNQDVEIEQSDIIFVVNNDLSNKIDIGVGGAFVNGRALNETSSALYEGESEKITLQRRRKAEIMLSDVETAIQAEGGHPSFVTGVRLSF